MFVTIGAWDFSPEIKVRLIGTSVFALRATPRQESPVLRQCSPPQIPNYRAVVASSMLFMFQYLTKFLGYTRRFRHLVY